MYWVLLLLAMLYGGIIIVGAIVLLYLGVIKLDKVAKGQPIGKIEFGSWFVMTTPYPSLLFIGLGVALVFLPVAVAPRPSGLGILKVRGTASGDVPKTAKVIATIDNEMRDLVNLRHNRTFEATITPRVTSYIITIQADSRKTIPGGAGVSEINEGVVDFGECHFDPLVDQ